MKRQSQVLSGLILLGMIMLVSSLVLNVNPFILLSYLWSG